MSGRESVTPEEIILSTTCDQASSMLVNEACSRTMRVASKISSPYKADVLEIGGRRLSSPRGLPGVLGKCREGLVGLAEWKLGMLGSCCPGALKDTMSSKYTVLGGL